MPHILFGYDIKDGRAVINKEQAITIQKIFENYLSGMSLKKTAQAAGLNVSHSSIMRILLNDHYLGDEYYPALVSRQMMDSVKRERMKREKSKYSNPRWRKEEKKETIYTIFSIPKEHEHIDKEEDPIKRAEQLYYMIRNEG